MAKNTTPKAMTAKSFQKQLQSDRLTRMRFVNGLADLLEDMGVSRQEISDGLPSNILTRGKLPGGGEVAVVVISKSDSQKNTSSIVIV